MPIKLFKFAGILVQTLNEEKTASLDIVDDSISVHSVHHFMYIDLFATHSELSGGQSCCMHQKLPGCKSSVDNLFVSVESGGDRCRCRFPA